MSSDHDRLEETTQAMADTNLDTVNTTTTTTTTTTIVPDQPTEPDLPMSMTASMILTSLPKDSSQALKEVETIDADRKVTVRFSALPGAPALGKHRAFKVSANQRFEAVVSFLRKKIGVRENEALFCYVNSVFAPGLDEGVGNLWRCFKLDDQLNVSYSMTPAFG